MTDLRQAAQQALDFVQRVTAWEGGSSAISGLPDRHGTLTALRTALEQQQAEPSQWRDMIVVSLVREGVNKHKARELADHFAAQQQAEPVLSRWIGCGECDSTFKCYGSGKECIRLPMDQQAEPGTREGFNDWWNGDYDDSENRFEQDSAAYWAWAGWQAAQRPWVGLTKVQQDDFADAYGSYEAVCAIEAKLKERNT